MRLYLKAGRSVEQLNYMANAGLRGLGESGLQPLDHKQNQNLPGQS